MDYREGYVALIDKPLEWTSTDVVRKIKYTLQRRGWGRKIKVGHAGTLDPLASGVLLICIGKATKRVDELQSERKEYIADVVLGATTPSYDMEHPIDATYPTEHITRELIDEVLLSLTGERLQSPPLFSAKKVEGVRAYEIARAGESVELRQSLITIYNIEVLEFAMPNLKLCVECSKGTYIRSLASEIGEGLKSGGYLSGLRRTKSGGYRAEDGWELEDFLKSIDECETIL
ncbi:MAG: tRNA pseudouridine(55) synthase TruB [Rikenellaceae bacterium]